MGNQPPPSKQQAGYTGFLSEKTEPVTPTSSLVPSLRATMVAPEKRRVVIPGRPKRSRQKPAVGMIASPLRSGLVLATFVLLLAMTLVSFVPLGTGQGSFTLFSRVSSWVQSHQVDWSVQAQVAPTSPAVVVPTAAFGPVTVTLPKSEYVAMAEQDAIAAGIPPTYFVRQIEQESGFNPNAHSPAGAEGIAQFMPSTAAGLGINPWDPAAALQAAARMMASYTKEFGGDYAKALASYNSGSATVKYAITTCGANWISCLPLQTQEYIAIIMGG
jgi:hypothetical protein